MTCNHYQPHESFDMLSLRALDPEVLVTRAGSAHRMQRQVPRRLHIACGLLLCVRQHRTADCIGGDHTAATWCQVHRCCGERFVFIAISTTTCSVDHVVLYTPHLLCSRHRSRTELRPISRRPRQQRALHECGRCAPSKQDASEQHTRPCHGSHDDQDRTTNESVPLEGAAAGAPRLLEPSRRMPRYVTRFGVSLF